MNKNGTAVTGISIASWTATGLKFDPPTAETLLVPGDVIDVEVTSAGTCQNLTTRVMLARVYG